MKKYLTLQQACKKISNLCKVIGDVDADSLGASQSFIKEILKSGHNMLWISKSTGLLYFSSPKCYGNFLVLEITCIEDNYSIEIL